MNEHAINEIIDVFFDEKAVIEQLLSLSEKKKASIIKGDVKSLGLLLESEEILSYQIGELESRRTALTSALSSQFGLSGGTLTLLQIAETTQDPKTREKLHTLREELSVMLKKQERYNRTNQELLKRKMNYIDVMLGALMQHEPVGETYDCAGNTGKAYRSAGLFDRSI